MMKKTSLLTLLLWVLTLTPPQLHATGLTSAGHPLSLVKCTLIACVLFSLSPVRGAPESPQVEELAESFHHGLSEQAAFSGLVGSFVDEPWKPDEAVGSTFELASFEGDLALPSMPDDNLQVQHARKLQASSTTFMTTNEDQESCTDVESEAFGAGFAVGMFSIGVCWCLGCCTLALGFIEGFTIGCFCSFLYQKCCPFCTEEKMKLKKKADIASLELMDKSVDFVDRLPPETNNMETLSSGDNKVVFQNRHTSLV